MTFLPGHSHRAMHCSVQIGFGSIQVEGQAEPQLVKTWPFTGQDTESEERNIVHKYLPAPSHLVNS